MIKEIYLPLVINNVLSSYFQVIVSNHYRSLFTRRTQDCDDTSRKKERV